MKNGIDLLLILVLLATIGLLVYFGLRNGNTVELLSPITPFPFIEAAPITETSVLTRLQTATMIPVSVTIPIKTTTFTSRPTEILLKTTTGTLTITGGNITPIS